MKRILVIDDDPKISKALTEFFNPDHFEINSILKGSEAIKTLPNLSPDLILLDLKLPDMSGLELLKRIKEKDSDQPVIVITGYSSAQSAMECVKEGAYEYISKPFRMDELNNLINKVLNKTEPVEKVKNEIAESLDLHKYEDELIGRSPEMVEIAKLIGRVASTDASVLILGESGTGKELVAKAIHRNSPREDKPFLSVNCAALPETLLESELFGHEKGAFTGAYHRKLGKFEQCHGGTVFLDEIADMSLLTQSKVLRVLQQQEFERVGGNQTIKVNVRVIAATNKSLVNCMKEKSFRVDLFYRLKVVSIYMPPLRERKSDIPLLAQNFVQKFAHKVNKPIKGVSDQAMKLFFKYSWPGNVRELENNIHSAIVMSKEEVLLPEHFPIFQEKDLPLDLDFEAIKEDYSKIFSQILGPICNKLFSTSEGKVFDHLIWALEKSLVDYALKYCKGNQVRAAQLLGICRNTLRSRMSKYKLPP
ncbi:MAG: sigma-54-dependent Fis family transcriptional regulator [candidate division Zixibacteria bacterium]|nr:sigma-54-dependent Fis family transcriptional regulator [candidate division Zixibacteria bacterium]